MNAAMPLLQVKKLQKYFPVFSQGFLRRQAGLIKAVDDISFELMPGEPLGLLVVATVSSLGVEFIRPKFKQAAL